MPGKLTQNAARMFAMSLGLMVLLLVRVTKGEKMDMNTFRLNASRAFRFGTLCCIAYALLYFLGYGVYMMSCILSQGYVDLPALSQTQWFRTLSILCFFSLFLTSVFQALDTWARTKPITLFGIWSIVFWSVVLGMVLAPWFFGQS